MKTGRDLIAMLGRLRDTATTTIPRELANSMLKETQQNFKDQAYGNNGFRKPWPDRPFESELNYPKLMHRGRLYNSIKPGTRLLGRHSAVAYLRAYNKVARIHNEGGIAAVNYYGDSGLRVPPDSKKKVFIGRRNIRQRQFMGFGERSRKWFTAVMNKEFGKIISQ